MAFVDWYAVLAIEPSADEATVRKAYRRAALKYHPDKNPDDAAADQFDLLGQALAVLTDAAKRAAFDAARARHMAAAAVRAGESERMQALRAKLDAPAPAAARPAYTAADLEALRQESYEHRRALDALRSEQARSANDIACRTLADASRTFDSVAEARAFVDAHAAQGARLQASWRPPAYTKEYEEATLQRLARVQRASAEAQGD